MTITKFFRDGNTGEKYVAFSSWGERYSINADLLINRLSGYYYPEFFVYELLEK
jgi:hypothetical protein